MPNDTALVVSGVVRQMWRGLSPSEVVSAYPELSGSTLVVATADVCAGDTYSGGEFTPKSPAYVPPSPPQLRASAINMSISGGDVAGIEGSFNVAGALYLGTGLIMVFFTDSVPSGYLAVFTIGGDYTVDVVDTNTSYLMFQVKSGGTEADPTSLLSLEVYTL